MGVRTERFIVAALAIIAAGCGSTRIALPPPPEGPAIIVDNPICVSCGWLLEDTQVSQLQQQAADGGDAEAAFRLSLHFSSADSPEQRQAWERRAAQLGHRIAQYNVWFTLRESSTCATQLEALAWLEKSATQGFREATEQLGPFRELVARCHLSPRETGVPPNNSFKPKPLRGSA